MTVRFQLVIDCANPDQLARFWAAALGYELAPPPAGFATWNDYYRDVGVPDEELADGADRISDPHGHGPSIWFHVVPEAKVVKNRLHLDVHASGERADPIETRKRRVLPGETNGTLCAQHAGNCGRISSRTATNGWRVVQ